MRPRHVLLLVLLAAIPVGLAVVLARGDGTKRAHGVPVTQLSLKLIAGSPVGAQAACGVTHHYTLYPATSTIRFRGAISRPGKWSVAVKLKACTAGAFRSSGQVAAKVRPDGRYKGTFPAPIGGYYFARAELELSGRRVARSSKRYFQVR